MILEFSIGHENFKEIFQQVPFENQQLSEASAIELTHYANIKMTVKSEWWQNDSPNPNEVPQFQGISKVVDIFFRLFEHSIETAKRKLTIKLWVLVYLCFLQSNSSSGSDEDGSDEDGSDEEALAFIIQTGFQASPEYFMYRPRSDVLIFKAGFVLPQLLVEIYTKSSSDILHDRIGMLLQAASIIRLANTFLDQYKEEKSFFIVAIYIHCNGKAERFILFQKKEDKDNHVRSQFLICVFTNQP